MDVNGLELALAGFAFDWHFSLAGFLPARRLLLLPLMLCVLLSFAWSELLQAWILLIMHWLLTLLLNELNQIFDTVLPLFKTCLLLTRTCHEWFALI